MSRRAHCGIPQWLISFQPCALGAKRLRSPPGFGVGKKAFQPAGALSTGQYTRAVSKQRQRPQTANRPGGKHAPMAPAHAKSSFSLWTRHYRKYRLVKYKRPINGGAPILSDMSDKSDKSD